MEEKILIKSERKDIKKICSIFPLIGILLFLCYFVFSVNSYRVYYRGGYQRVERPLLEAIMSSITGDGALPFVALIIPVFILCGYLIYKNWSKVEMIVTDKRVYGYAANGKRVDLPLDAISAVATLNRFSGIAVTTASGAIKFLMLANRDEIHKVISKLLVERQNKPTATITQEVSQSNADELKKFKDLLDSGIISQEEFDAKKKQLLGL